VTLGGNLTKIWTLDYKKKKGVKDYSTILSKFSGIVWANLKTYLERLLHFFEWFQTRECREMLNHAYLDALHPLPPSMRLQHLPRVIIAFENSFREQLFLGILYQRESK
jgi:hypothetical protein